MSNILHNFGDVESHDLEGKILERFMDSELNYILGSESGRRVNAEHYVELLYK